MKSRTGLVKSLFFLSLSLSVSAYGDSDQNDGQGNRNGDRGNHGDSNSDRDNRGNGNDDHDDRGSRWDRHDDHSDRDNRWDRHDDHGDRDSRWNRDRDHDDRGNRWDRDGDHDNQGPGTPTSIKVSANNSQSATVGAALGSALQAIVMDSNSKTVGAGIAVTWASTAGGGSVSSCASSLTNASGIASCIPTLGTTAGTNTFTASISGSATPASFTATGKPGNAAQLIFSLAPVTLNAGVCTGYTASSQDAYGNLSPVSSSIIISPSSPSGKSSGVFYTDNLCTSSASSVTLTANSNSTSFYFRDLVAESISLSITNNAGLTNPGTLTITVQPGTPAQLALTGSSPINAAICTAFTVTSQDAESNPATVSSTTITQLSGSGSGAFYADSACASIPITNATIAANSSKTTFYFMDTLAESVTLSAVDSALVLKTTGLAVTVKAASPTKLMLSGSASPSAAVCTAYTVTAQDAEGNPSNVLSTTPVNLSGNSSGAFYASSSCVSPAITSTAITASSSSQTFYFMDNTAQSTTLHAADNAAALTSSQGLAVSIVAGTAAKLSLSGASPVNAGACALYTVTSQDAEGNTVNVGSTTTIHFSGNSLGAFYADSTCASTPIVGTSILKGANSRSVYFMDTKAETVNLTAADSTGVLSPATALPVQVNAVGAYQLSLSGPSSVNAGSCTAYTVTTQDKYGNAVYPSSISGVLTNLTGIGSGGIYSDSGCSAAISSITVPATANSATFYFLDDTAQNATLSVTDGDTANLISTPSAMAFVVAVQPSTANTLALSGSTTGFTAGQCVPFTLTSTDTWANASNVTSNVTISLVDLLVSTTTPGGGSFYSDRSCGTPFLITTAVIASGQDLTTIYFKDTTAQSLTLSAGSSILSPSPTSNQVTVSFAAGTPASITVSANNNQSATAGSALASALQAIVTDSNSNPVGAGISVTWASTAGGGSVTSCASSLTNASSIASCTPTLGTLAGTNTFTALISYAGSGASTPASFTATGISGNAAQLALSGAATINAGTCNLYTVTSQDAVGNAVNVASTTTIHFSGNSSGAFYASSDSTCGSTPILTTLIVKGTNKSSFYFMDAKAETVNLNGADNASVLSSAAALPVQVTALNPSQLSLSGPSSVNTGSCTAYTVIAQDKYGNAVYPSSSLGVLIELAEIGSGGIYSDNACSSPISSITLPVIANTATFYFLDDTAQSATLSATDGDAANLISTPSAMAFAVTVQASTANTLILSGNTIGFTAGQCVPFTLTTTDTWANTSNVTSNVTISLVDLLISTGTPGAGSYYSDSSCGTPFLITTAVIASGQDLTTIYFKDTTAQGLILGGAEADGNNTLSLAPASNNVTVSFAPGTPTSITVSANNYQSATVGSALGSALQAIVMDSNSNPVGAGIAVTWASAAGGGSVSSCSSSITNASSIASCTPTLGTPAGTNTFTASITGVTGTPASFTATGTAGAVSILVSTAGNGQNATVGTSVPLGPTVKATDAYGNPISGVNITFTVTAGNGSVSPPSAMTNTSGLASTQFTLGTTTGNNAITAAIPSSVSVSFSETGTPGAVQKLLFGTEPSSSGMTGLALASQPSFLAQDTYGNLATNFVGSVSLAAFKDAACSVPASGTLSATLNPITASAGQGTFAGVSYALAGTVYLRISAGNGVTTACSSAISLLSSFSISIGTSFTCASNLGNVQCWGSGSSGQLGNNSTASSEVPVQVQGLTSGVLALGAGGTHACAGTTSGLWCWGLNFYGQLGNNTTVNSQVPVAVSGIAGGVQQVGGGTSHTCALLVSGSVYCWGYNFYGQLGNGTTTDSRIPVQVQGLPSPAQSISVGNYSTCALLATGVAYCWGYNDFGQLGNGSTVNSSTPVAVQGLSGTITAIAIGFEHACALTGGSAQCWGNNQDGQIGNNSFSPSLTPQMVSGISGNATQLLAGGQNFNCVTTQAGAVQCWGQGSRFQLGNNSSLNSPVAVQVSGLTSGYTSLATGYFSSCAYNGLGMQCWGFGTSGQLGNGTNTSSAVPVSVSGY